MRVVGFSSEEDHCKRIWRWVRFYMTQFQTTSRKGILTPDPRHAENLTNGHDALRVGPVPWPQEASAAAAGQAGRHQARWGQRALEKTASPRRQRSLFVDPRREKKGHREKLRTWIGFWVLLYVSPWVTWNWLSLPFFWHALAEEQKKFMERSTALQQVGKNRDPALAKWNIGIYLGTWWWTMGFSMDLAMPIFEEKYAGTCWFLCAMRLYFQSFSAALLMQMRNAFFVLMTCSTQKHSHSVNEISCQSHF